MKFSDYILIDAINPELKATDKEGVIREMVQSLVDAGGIEQEHYEEIVKAFIKREELGSTGWERGIAFPETKHPSVKRLVVAFGISAEGIDFGSPDGEKVQLFILVITPYPDESAGFLRVIEHLTRRLKDDTLCRSLLPWREKLSS